ncbi:MAG: hypothetical protein AMXMBFR83_09130 [Phycisphaerae bacterium]
MPAADGGAGASAAPAVPAAVAPDSTAPPVRATADAPAAPVESGGPAAPAGSAHDAVPAPTPSGPEPAAGTAPPAEAASASAPPAQAGPSEQIHAGKIVRVTAEEVFVVIDTGQQGYVPLIEFAAQPLPHVGDDISVLIERSEDKTGLLKLSKRQADEFTFWQSVQPGDVLEGVITGMNKGGLDVDIGGARAFLPASQVDMRRIHDISTFIGEHVRCVVTQVDRATQDLVVSRRRLQEIEKQEQRKAAVEAIQEGEIRTGRVSNVTEFGAFVSLGGVDALLHMSDMSWGRVRPPAEVVRKGDEITVKVLKVDRAAGKVSVGLKQARPNPWDNITERYQEGARVKGKVLRFADFGAFLELEDAVEALLPISEMSWTQRIGHPADLLKEGEEREVVVLKVDPARRRISVGLRQTEPNPWDTLEQQFPINATVKGKVTKIMEYGAFVELLPGIEGLVHISALSDRRVRAVGDVVKEGQEVEVRVLKIDRGAQRVSLSMKPQEAPRRPAGDAPGKESKPAKKPRPARGGLSSHFDWMGEGLKRIKPPG